MKGVSKHLLANMLQDILIPDFGCSLRVAFNNVCTESLYKLKSLSAVILVGTNIFVS